MSDTPDMEQLSFHLETSSEPEVSRWNYKLEQAKRLALKMAVQLASFDQLIQKIICSEGYQTNVLWEVISNKELTKKERLKIQICYLLDREKSMTMA